MTNLIASKRPGSYSNVDKTILLRIWKISIDKSIGTIWNLNGPHKSLCNSCRRFFLSLLLAGGRSILRALIIIMLHILSMNKYTRESSTLTFLCWGNITQRVKLNQHIIKIHPRIAIIIFFSILLDIYILSISHSLYTGYIFRLERRNLESSVNRRKRFFLL